MEKEVGLVEPDLDVVRLLSPGRQFDGTAYDRALGVVAEPDLRTIMNVRLSEEIEILRREK